MNRRGFIGRLLGAVAAVAAPSVAAPAVAAKVAPTTREFGRLDSVRFVSVTSSLESSEESLTHYPDTIYVDQRPGLHDLRAKARADMVRAWGERIDEMMYRELTKGGR